MENFIKFTNITKPLTTEVVPSPTSSSCNWANSTRTRAAGCSTSNKRKMVAPSLVTVTS